MHTLAIIKKNGKDFRNKRNISNIFTSILNIILYFNTVYLHLLKLSNYSLLFSYFPTYHDNTANYAISRSLLLARKQAKKLNGSEPQLDRSTLLNGNVDGFSNFNPLKGSQRQPFLVSACKSHFATGF